MNFAAVLIVISFGWNAGERATNTNTSFSQEFTAMAACEEL